MKNAGFPLPVARITVNLSPAQIKKEGTEYDLAIATAILACMGMVKKEGLENTAFLGELALSGEVHKNGRSAAHCPAVAKRRDTTTGGSKGKCGGMPDGTRAYGGTYAGYAGFIIILTDNGREKKKSGR